MSIEDKYDLLTTPAWTLKQLMEYTGIKSRTTGIRLKKRAIAEQDGSVPYGSQFVKRDAILTLLGTTQEKELKALKQIMKENNYVSI